ncbi:SDR family NAD(P)-dependent oxidoreductase, partial [Zafaria sp. J156]|uniref:SDR family NAD(P)-dependent oxidoreductase n=1 Tax=Zafaria sp. J156 TaxID=3116490 RepID=UPI002E7A19C9
MTIRERHPEAHFTHVPQATALVTGATAGIGAEFARQLASQGHALVLVARDAARLESSAASLRSRFAVPVETITADLLTDDGVEAVARRLASVDSPVALLVNNAGHGLRGNFADNELSDELDLLRIHTQAPLVLAHAALRAMGAAGGGRIINVASMAAFTPHGTYSAAKALMVSFSRWANEYYRPRGITVTAVCPGYVRTEFHERMRLEHLRVPRFAWLQPDEVVQAGLADAAAGRAVSIPTLRYKAGAVLARLLPDALLARGGGGGGGEEGKEPITRQTPADGGT